MKVKKTHRPKRRSLREIAGDRALMAGLLFSVVVHGAVIFHLQWPPKGPEVKPRRLMVARLIRLAAPAPPEPGETAEVPDPGEAPTGTERQAVPVPEAQEPEAPAPVTATGDEDEERVSVSAQAAKGVKGARAAAAVAIAVSPPASKVEAVRPPARIFAGRGRTSIALAPSADRAEEKALTEIRRMIDAQKSYPRLAMRNGWEGEVLVEISLGDGTLQDVQVVGASGYRILDKATLKAVRRAGPFPPLEGKVRVPVAYRLKTP